MMDMEIFDDFLGSNDQMIVKGKRTKRLRPSSSASSSGGGGGGEFNYNKNYSYNSLASSPATSSEISTSTEEDEDMANCLILLARGGFSPRSEGEIKPQVSSRKLAEMAATTNGKVGIYVYECKTCSRTFPSFQALGGHRASHKKPKAAGDVDRRKPPPTARRPDEEEEKIRFNKSNTVTPSTSTQLPNHVENKPKLHECSICGSEFASGQALGGHMRRHRSTIITATRSGCDDDVGEKISRNNILGLDLNLPAPAEDDLRETEFRQFSSPRLVFSSAALVDCHY